jgi:flagellar protein FlgJ
MATKKGQIDFIGTIYPEAKRLYEAKNGIHPLFVTAQAALETGWVVRKEVANNLFGITKGSSWTGKTRLILTTEYFKTDNVKFNLPEMVESVAKMGENNYRYKVYRLFRDYDSIADCLEDHLSLLKKPMYADAWPYRNNPKEFARRIVDESGAKYATAPNYASVMSSIIDSVERYTKELGL